MKKLTIAILAVCLLLAPPTTQAAQVIPVGQVIGLELTNGTVTVAELGEAQCRGGLQVGDQILSIDGAPIGCAQDVRDALRRSDGTVEVLIQRQGRQSCLRLSPCVTDQGPQLGIKIRQGITGIGTVTWYDPETGRFGCLGHGVSDSSGHLVQMTAGRAFQASVLSVKRGKCGEPGLLRGGVDAQSPLGQIEKNTPQGVFGITQQGWEGQTVETAGAESVRTGPATIRSTISGNQVKEYAVEILRLFPDSSARGRNMLLRITDPALLSATGGIVQGMSGSPILQNGKLVGAVTHVLVNDPTTGYGIFIENMLDAAA